MLGSARAPFTEVTPVRGEYRDARERLAPPRLCPAVAKHQALTKSARVRAALGTAASISEGRSTRWGSGSPYHIERRAQ